MLKVQGNDAQHVRQLLSAKSQISKFSKSQNWLIESASSITQLINLLIQVDRYFWDLLRLRVITEISYYIGFVSNINGYR